MISILALTVQNLLSENILTSENAIMRTGRPKTAQPENIRGDCVTVKGVDV